MADGRPARAKPSPPAVTPEPPPATTTPNVSQSSGTQPPEDVVAYRSELVFQESRGPIPSAAEIAGYAQVYPDAPAILFRELQAESAHRRAMEQEIVRGESRRADRGQLIAATVFILGLVIGGGLVALGHDMAGAAIVGADLVSGAAIFLRQYSRADADPLPKQTSEGPAE